MHIASPQEGLNVGVMGMFIQGIYQEENAIYGPLSYAGGDLRISFAAGGEAFMAGGAVRVFDGTVEI